MLSFKLIFCTVYNHQAFLNVSDHDRSLPDPFEPQRDLVTAILYYPIFCICSMMFCSELETLLRFLDFAFNPCNSLFCAIHSSMLWQSLQWQPRDSFALLVFTPVLCSSDLIWCVLSTTFGSALYQF